MRGKLGRLLILVGVLLLLAALGLTVYNLYDDYRASYVSRQTIIYLEQVIVPKAPYVPTPTTPPAEEELEFSIEEIEIPDYILDPGREMPILTVDGQEYIGTLSIDALNLRLPVISQWSYPSLKVAPCRYYGSAYTDDLVIAAHNYKAHFANLATLKIGDTVRFTDVDGNPFSYVVSAKETLPPTAISEMTCGSWPLTLFTCTTGGTYRVAIRCDLAE